MQQRKWKQKLSVLMAGVLLLGTLPTAAFAWEAPNTSWDTADEEVAARFFVGSDTHIGRNADATKKLENALNVFYELDPVVDGVLLAGDITNNGYVSEYTTLMSTINGSELKDKVVLAMGNHEFNSDSANAVSRFESNTQQAAREVLYYNADGLIQDGEEIGDDLVATVVKLSAKNYGGDYTDNYDLVKKALETSDEANSKAPIIVIAHHGVKNTAYVTEEWYGFYGNGEKDMVSLMAEYPQVIHFSGHSHATLEDARSIHQDLGFTAIQDGTIGAYFENESGKVSPTSGSAATRPDDSEIASQALRVDVLDDGTVKIYRMNLTTGEYMYEPWVFNAAKDNMSYTSDREDASEAPSFGENAAVTVDSVTKNSAVVKFPAANADSEDNLDMIHEYVVKLTPESGNAKTVRFFSDYYEPAEKQKDEWAVKITGLSAETAYTVSVTAETSFGVSSDTITGESFTTDAEPVYVTPKADVLNINFANSQGTDANGHTLETKGAPTFSIDGTLGVQVAHFDGSDDGLRYAMTAEDYNKYKDGYTMECLMKLNGSRGSPFSNQESAGCGFELNTNGKTLEFWNNVGGSYKKPTCDISDLKDGWFHAVATFDGATTKLYVNGVLQSAVDGAGSLKVPADSAKYFYLGADTNGSGTVQNACSCDIALARLYSGAMNAADVKATYEASMPAEPTEPDEIPTADILNVDFSTGSESDHSENSLTATKRGAGTVTYVEDEALGKKVANFGGNVAYSYPMQDQYSKLSNSMTFEVTYNYNALSNSGEYDLLSNQQSGGFGIGTEKGVLKFFCHVDGGYKTPSKNLTDTGVWHHAVGVFDGSKVKLYLDGVLVNEVTASGKVGLPSSTANEVFIGGDSNTNNGLQFPSNVKIATARIYSAALTAEQIAALAESELTAEPPVPDEPEVEFPWSEDSDAKIAVISDDHLYDTEALGTDGTAFQKYLSGDRKMLVESEKILDTALEQIKNSGTEYLLISGDLTKDGEKVNHELLAEKLAAFEDESGIEVFVINGNHDISNAHAVSFTDNGTYPTDTVDTEMFKEIYTDFGYDLAVAEDPNSLSYAADLGDDYRLIVMDACIYNNDAENPQQQTGGKFSDETLAWVLNQIEAARRDGRTPIGMMHHGLVPHTAIQPTFFSEYLVDDYANVSKALADAGMSLVFTGHFHSQDAAYITTEAGNVLHDVETGSLVTDPSPIRYVALDGSTASYVSAPILNVDGLTKEDLSAPELAGNGTLNFSDYSHKYLLSGLEGQVPMMLTAVLMQQGYDQQTAYQTAQEAANSKPFESAGYNGTLAQFMAACMAYHYTGDEDADTSPAHQQLSALAAGLTQNENALYQLLGTAASALIHDTQTPGDTSEPLADNAADITLTEGEDLPALPIEQTLGMENESASLKLAQIGRYISSETNKDGGVMEIVAYNPANQCAYAVNGQSGVLAAIPLNSLKAGQTTVTVLEAQTVDVETLVNVDGFSYGDMTSVSVSPDGKTLAVAIQAEDYTANGRVALFTADSNGSLTFVDAIETGIQPDMVTFTPDGSKILTANEGEPRLGYTNDAAVDPAGSVTVIDVKSATAQTIGFTAYDSAEARQALVDAGIVLKKGTKPSVDLEPEYIACSNTTAYISLQEANAIAVLDLKTNTYKGIYSVGFEDYSKIAVDINGNGDGYSPETYENLLGIRMPDGISMVTIGGVDYILTANEGDSRAWPVEDTELDDGTTIEAESDVNEVKNKKSPTGNISVDKKVTWFDASQYDGLKNGVDYLFGGRSFTMFKVTDSGLVEVFDSKNDFESKTADYLPDYFNCSNDDVELDSRSGKKGPEPETVVTGVVDGKTYAFVTLERIGGIMVYDITDPAKVSYVNYINSRDFENVDEDGVGADDSPEGLAFVPASQSPTGGALLLAACEVGSTVAVYDLTPVKNDSGDDNNGGSSGGSSSGGSSVSGYPITVKKPDHGTVTTSPKQADKGDTVTITVKPDAGYELDELIVTDKNGDSIKVTEKGNGKYTFTMPNGKVSVEAAFEKIEQSAANPFVDVSESNYFYDAVQWAVKQGITSGTSATTFAPNVTCTRAQMATFLWRAAGSPTPKSAVMPFHDVLADAYYYTAVQWAVEQGITSGTSAITFSPDAVVTRAQTVTFLWRFSDSPAATSGNFFTDVTANAYYADAVQWAAREGITSGTGATTFDPDAGCTRAQIVTFLWHYMAE